MDRRRELIGPQWPSWSEHDAMHTWNPLAPSEVSRYVLDEYDREHLYCWRCRLRVRRPTAYEVGYNRYPLV